ncbi:MAG: SpoIIE family protein phosphatase, partial [Ignavibacteriae bacterium]|nr:SpoIIE family protein phosphatase [Ignavibacteriota bacterium]
MTANIDKQLELNSLIEYSQLINTNLNQEFILGHILLSIMGKMLITKGMVLTNDNRINSPENSYIIKASKGVDKKLSGLSIVTEFPKEPYFELSAIENPSTFLADNGFNFFFKIYFINKLVGILCLGNKISRNSIDKNEFIFIETMLNISAPAIENSMKFDEITRLNNSLSSQLQQLKSLFELSKEFNSNFQDREKIVKLLRYSLLGNFGVKDLVIFSKFRSEDYYIIHSEKNFVLDTKLSEELGSIKEAEIIDNSNLSPLRKLLFENNINLLIPISSNNKVETIVCIGHKLNKTEFTLSDIQFLESIVNLSVISIDNSLLFDEYTEKLKIENELNIAREMQIALLPKSLPEAKGYDLYAVNYPASQVGGDYYDIIKLSDSEFAFVIADVSGKGTPASLLMSNIQSAVHSYLK